MCGEEGWGLSLVRLVERGGVPDPRSRLSVWCRTVEDQGEERQGVQDEGAGSAGGAEGTGIITIKTDFQSLKHGDIPRGPVLHKT